MKQQVDSTKTFWQLCISKYVFKYIFWNHCIM